jgi:hypothetical protein
MNFNNNNIPLILGNFNGNGNINRNINQGLQNINQNPYIQNVPIMSPNVSLPPLPLNQYQQQQIPIINSLIQPQQQNLNQSQIINPQQIPQMSILNPLQQNQNIQYVQNYGRNSLYPNQPFGIGIASSPVFNNLNNNLVNNPNQNFLQQMAFANNIPYQQQQPINNNYSNQYYNRQ